MDLERRLAIKSTEKDRYVHAFVRGHISEEELSEYVTDLKNQIHNLRLLIRGVEDELATKREHTLVAENVEAWLLNLRERLEEVEEDSEEGFAKRRKLVKLLVEEISVGRDEDGRLRTHITYRFGPPDGSDGEGSESMFVGGVKNPTAA